MGGQSGVLCRYFLHGACKFGADCAFSHSLADSESQVGAGQRLLPPLPAALLTLPQHILCWQSSPA